MSIITRSEWGRPKPSFPHVQKAHPLSQGLVFCVDLHEGYGGKSGTVANPETAPNSIVDVVNQIPGNFCTGSSGTATWKGSPYGWSANFTGTGTGTSAERISFSANSACPRPLRITSKVTIACLLKYTASTNANARIASRAAAGNASPFIAYGIYQASVGNINFGIGTSSFSSLSGAISGGIWYLIHGVYDGANMSLYIDGQFNSSSAKTGTLDDTGNFSIGADQETTANETFNGQVAGVWVWNRPLTEYETALHFVDPFGMLRPQSKIPLYKKASSGGGSTFKYRRTLSPLGARVGSRQVHV